MLLMSLKSILFSAANDHFVSSKLLFIFKWKSWFLVDQNIAFE